VLLPTPPFALETTMTDFTFGIARGLGGPADLRGMVGGALLRGNPSGFSWARIDDVVPKRLRSKCLLDVSSLA
jgi:hypothetical protein